MKGLVLHMRFNLILGLLLMSFVANAQYLHMLERADSSSRKVVVTNNSGIQRYVEVDSLATLLGVNGSVDSLSIVQDTILVYFRSGSELGRDTIGAYNRSQIDSKDALRVLYTDTAAMLSPYIKITEVNDTLSAYYLSTEVDSADALRVLYTDTAAMLLPYITEVEVNDTLSVYYLSSQVDSADALRVLYTDTASMLSSYTRRTELQDTASNIRNDLGADIGGKTDTTDFNQVELTYNPNSQPILNKHYREVDKQTIYIEEINNAAQGVSRLLNITLSSGRNAYQDAEVVWIADNSDSTVTYSNKGADFTLSRNGNIYGKDNEGEWFEWMTDYPNIDFQENKQKAGLRLFSYIDYGFYRSRVEADTGTLYSIDTCTQNKIDMSLSSSITMIPDGAKAGKLYSIFPNDGSGDFTVVRATTATRVNAEGLIEEVAANVPRIDHTNGCPDLLIEPQRTNEAKASEGLDDATYWLLARTTIAGDTETDPKGGTNSFLLSETVDNLSHVFLTASAHRPSVASGETWTQSLFVKKGDGANAPDIIQLTHSNAEFGANNYANFDISIGGGASGTVTASNGGTAEIRYYGNGWYRISFTATSTGAGSGALLIVFTNNNPTATRAPSYAGQTDANVYIWGAQLEEGSYPTSYIPTEGSTVTRNADEIELTGAADLLGDSEGTLFVEASYSDASQASFLSLSDGTGANRVYFFNTTGSITFTTRIANVNQCSISGGTSIDFTFTKIVGAYKQDDYAFYQDGTQIGLDNSGSTYSDGTLTRVGFDGFSSGTLPFYGRIRQLAVFPTRLTNTQLENITQ